MPQLRRRLEPQLNRQLRQLRPLGRPVRPTRSGPDRPRPRRLRGTAAALLTGALLGPLLPAAPAAAEGELSPPLGDVLVLAHRGLSGLFPEHTFPANDAAVRAGADFLECDLQLTRDEVLVCVHDTTVQRTARRPDGSTPTGRVDSYTLAELRQLDWGLWRGERFRGLQIVPFEEQVRCYSSLTGGRARFHIETKAPQEYQGRLEPALLSVLTAYGLVPEGPPDPQTSRVIVQSFELASLQRMRELAPSVPTAFLSLAPPADQQTGSTPAYVDVVAPSAQFLLAQPTYTALAHASGHEVHTFTVDDPTQLDLLLQQGVDGIFTNRADVLRPKIDARGTGTEPAERGAPATFPDGCPGVAGAVTGPVSAGEQPVVPEVPLAPLLPLAALGVGVGALALRRRARS